MSNTHDFHQIPIVSSSNHRYLCFSLLGLCFRGISDWYLKNIYHFCQTPITFIALNGMEWIFRGIFWWFLRSNTHLIIKYPLVPLLSLFDEFLNYFFTQILITFIKYQSLALLCFLDELLEEFLNDHFLEEFLEDFFTYSNYWNHHWNLLNNKRSRKSWDMILFIFILLLQM